MIQQLEHIIRRLSNEKYMTDLTFNNCVLKEFEFLTNDYGFKCVQSDKYYLRYQSKFVFVELKYDSQKSFEIDLSFGLLDCLYNGKERPFYLIELVRFLATDNEMGYSPVQASTTEKVVHLVPKLAGFVSKYAKEYLAGNKFSYKALSDFREKESDRYKLHIKLKDIRASVKLAWKKRDYATVIKLYEPVKKHITGSELKKLEYCHKHFSDKR